MSRLKPIFPPNIITRSDRPVAKSHTPRVVKSNTPVPEALTKIAEILRISSGYPDNTVADSGMAFAYGLMIGAAFAMQREFEGKESEYERR